MRKTKQNKNYQIRNTETHGKSIFAVKDIKKGETVFIVQGKKTKKPSIYTIPIDYGEYIDPISPGKYLCHSCNPSCGIKDKTKVVAMRNIREREEINIDYAMIVSNYGKEMTKENRICKCGSKNCRGKLGAYKELPEKLKETYKGFISEYLTK